MEYLEFQDISFDDEIEANQWATEILKICENIN